MAKVKLDRGCAGLAARGSRRDEQDRSPDWRAPDWLSMADATALTARPPLPSVASPAVFDLSLLSLADGFVVQGDTAGDFSGFSVSDAGDINGDGFDDFIIGAPRGDNAGAGSDAGEAYVIFGKGSGIANIDLTGLTLADGFIIQGINTSNHADWAGYSVSAAGDFNGDGFDDLLVGVPYGDVRNGIGGGGNAYLIYGKASGFANIDLFSPGSAGFVVMASYASDGLGWSVADAGDVNGDGFDDIIIGARFNSEADVAGGGREGAAYVIFGRSSSLSQIDIQALGGDGFIIYGDALLDDLGVSVASAGDVNGDGFDDMIVGAPYGNDGGTDAGEAYVVFGKSGPFGVLDGQGRRHIDLSTLGTAEGFVIQGDGPDDRLGFSVASAGDINGDGFDDIVVGAKYGDDGVATANAGEAYVIFGRAGAFGAVDGTGRRVIDVTGLAATDGFVIKGDAIGDWTGWCVSNAGDFNGDGFDELLIGSPYGDAGESNAGETFVIFGKSGGFGPIDLTDLGPDIGFVVRGDSVGDNAGFSASAAGDVNGDGYDDLVIGAPYGDDGGALAGETYIIFGRPDGVPIPGGSGADSLTGGAAGERLLGFEGDDTLQGNGGGDTLDGAGGIDWADYASAPAKVRADLKSPGTNSNHAAGDSYVGIENLRGTAFKDTLNGDDLANRIEGLGQNDIISARDGADTLVGGAGKDKLKGGTGADRFDLTSAAAADAETLQDFAAGDKIALDSDVFGLPEGALAAGRFVVGGAAGDGNDRLIYKAGQGRLYFDPDGTGGQVQVLIATFSNLASLGAGDFVVI